MRARIRTSLVGSMRGGVVEVKEEEEVEDID